MSCGMALDAILMQCVTVAWGILPSEAANQSPSASTKRRGDVCVDARVDVYGGRLTAGGLHGTAVSCVGPEAHAADLSPYARQLLELLSHL